MQIPESGPQEPRKPIDHRRIAGEFMRFLLMGGMNTLVAYLIYLVLLNWIRYEIAYAIGYATGIVIAYWVGAAFVFRKPMRGRSALRFPLVYVAQFLVSAGILHVAVETMHLPHWLAFIVAVGLTIPVTFVLSRWVLHAG
jgi:putative flippase GtrA